MLLSRSALGHIDSIATSLIVIHCLEIMHVNTVQPSHMATELCGTAFCRIAERLEWWTFYLLAADNNGVISKEKVRKQFDGSLWYEIAKDLEQKKMAQAHTSKAKWT